MAAIDEPGASSRIPRRSLKKLSASGRPSELARGMRKGWPSRTHPRFADQNGIAIPEFAACALASAVSAKENRPTKLRRAVNFLHERGGPRPLASDSPGLFAPPAPRSRGQHDRSLEYRLLSPRSSTFFDEQGQDHSQSSAQTRFAHLLGAYQSYGDLFLADRADESGAQASDP